MKVEINIDKKFFIQIGIVIVLCLICFFIGRCNQPKITDDGQKLIGYIEETDKVADEIYNDLIEAGCNMESAKQQSVLVKNLLGTLQSSTKSLEQEISSLKEATKVNNEVIGQLIEIHNAYKDSSNVLDVMIEKAEKYEEIIERLSE